MPGRRRARTGRGWDPAPARDRGEAHDSGENPDSGDAAGAEGTGENRAERRGGRRGRWGSRSAGERPQSAESADPAERAREICLRQLAVRPRTRAELATVLRQRGIADEVAEEVLGRYTEVGIVDDEAFARAWVTSRHHGRGLARRALAGELRRKGVDSESVGAALDELDPTTELETARLLVERRIRSERGTPDAVLRRMIGMLARKGYPPGVALRVVREVLAARAEEAELAGLDLAGLDLEAAVEALETEALQSAALDLPEAQLQASGDHGAITDGVG